LSGPRAECFKPQRDRNTADTSQKIHAGVAVLSSGDIGRICTEDLLQIIREAKGTRPRGSFQSGRDRSPTLPGTDQLLLEL
jgi:hypothetical protein